MTKFYWKYLPVLVIFMLGLALAPVSLAQEQGSTAVFSTSPEGADYTVDGQYFQQPTTAIWPAGSKHTLWVPPLQLRQSRTRFNFNGWFIGEKAYPDNPLVVTANAAYSTYVAKFDLSYSLAVALVSCPDPANCERSSVISDSANRTWSQSKVQIAKFKG